MDGPSEKKYCPNCKGDIPNGVYQTHEVHCRKHTMLCEICDEPIAIREKEEHDKEYHTPAICELCGESFPADTLDEHKEKKCPERSIPCPFCQLPFKKRAYDEHEEGCGSRTDVCELCNQRVMLREMEAHKARNCYTAKPDRRDLRPREAEVRNEGRRNYDMARSGMPRVGSHLVFTSGGVPPGPGDEKEAGPSVQGPSTLQIDPSWMEGISKSGVEGNLDSLVAQNIMMEQYHSRQPSHPPRQPSHSPFPPPLAMQSPDNSGVVDHSSEASAMKLQEEKNDRARMEASDASLARELQKELEGAGEGYLNGGRSFPLEFEPATAARMGRRANMNLRDQVYFGDDGPRSEPPPPYHIRPTPVFPISGQPPYLRPTPVPMPTVVQVTSSQSTLEEDEELARRLQKEEEEEEEVFDATYRAPRYDVPYTAMRSEGGRDDVTSRQLHIVGPGRAGSLEGKEEKLPCEFCDQQFSLADLMTHQVQCQIAHEKAVDVDALLRRASTPDESIEALLHCQHCMKQFPESYVMQHEAVCDHNPEKALLSSGLDRHQQAKASPPPSADEEDRVPCEFCNQLFPFQLLGQHQAVCDHNPEKALLSSGLDRHQEPKTSPPPSADEEDRVPCEFCNQLYTIQRLVVHQAICDKNTEVRTWRGRREPAHGVATWEREDYGTGGGHGGGDYRRHGGEGDHREGDHGGGDHRRGDHGGGDHRRGDHGGGDHRRGDNPMPWEQRDDSINDRGGDPRGDDYGEGDYRRGDDYGEGDYRRGDDYGEGDYRRGDDYGEGDYRRGDHRGEGYGGRHSSPPFEKRDGVKDWSGRGSPLGSKVMGIVKRDSDPALSGNATSGTGRGANLPPLERQSVHQFKTSSSEDMDVGTEINHRGNPASEVQIQRVKPLAVRGYSLHHSVEDSSSVAVQLPKPTLNPLPPWANKPSKPPSSIPFPHPSSSTLQKTSDLLAGRSPCSDVGVISAEGVAFPSGSSTKPSSATSSGGHTSRTQPQSSSTSVTRPKKKAAANTSEAARPAGDKTLDLQKEPRTSVRGETRVNSKGNAAAGPAGRPIAKPGGRNGLGTKPSTLRHTQREDVSVAGVEHGISELNMEGKGVDKSQSKPSTESETHALRGSGPSGDFPVYSKKPVSKGVSEMGSKSDDRMEPPHNPKRSSGAQTSRTHKHPRTTSPSLVDEAPRLQHMSTKDNASGRGGRFPATTSTKPAKTVGT